jgi:DNA transformation protein and related proteins
MSANDGIIDLLKDVLAPLGDVKARGMFSGHGLYLDGLFFALLFDGAAYFKVSDESRAAYEAEGMGPFTYDTSHGQHALKTYWRLPERLYDDPDEMMQWARAALHAARLAAAAKSKSKAKPTPHQKSPAQKPPAKKAARKPPGRKMTLKPKT